MKGKKVDNEFISQYISKCVSKKIFSSEDMVIHAKARINEIDNKIKDVEKMKIERSKLLDVISVFQKPEKITSIKEIEALSLYQIKNHDICGAICFFIKKMGSCTLGNISSIGHSKPDIIVSIKQLLEHKVLAKNEDRFVKGESFDEYYNTILKCD